MGWNFDGASHVTLANGSALSLSGSWTIAGWFRIPSINHSEIRRLISWGTPGTTNHVQIFYIGENSGFTNKNKVSARAIDSAGTDSGVPQNPQLLSSILNQWIAVGLTYDDPNNTLYLYVLDRSSGTYSTASVSANLGTVDPAGDMFFGVVPALTSGTFHIGDMAEWAKYDIYMADDEWHGFLHGGRPWRHPACRWHAPMTRGAT